MSGPAWTWLAYAGLVVAGFLTGVAGSFAQAITVDAGPVVLPVGLVGALLVAGLTFAAGARLGRRPILVGLPAAAWLLGVLPFTIERPEGDLVLTGDLLSYLYLLLGAGLAMIIAAVSTVVDQARDERMRHLSDGERVEGHSNVEMGRRT